MLKAPLGTLQGAQAARAGGAAALRAAPRSAAARAPRRAATAMAHPRRVAKVAKQIEREVGALLTTDQVVQAAVCPERRRGLDGAVSALASVTDVALTSDLQVAKVYLSVYSDAAGKAAALANLVRLEGYVRGRVGRAMRLRLAPEIRFFEDESIERAERVFALLDRAKLIESGEAEPPPLVIEGDAGGEEEEGFGGVDLGFFDSDEEEEEGSGEDEAGAGSGGDGEAAAVAEVVRAAAARRAGGDGGAKDGSRGMTEQELDAAFR